VCHREMKTGFGVGEVRRWSGEAAILSVRWQAWVYGVLVLAGYRAWGRGRTDSAAGTLVGRLQAVVAEHLAAGLRGGALGSRGFWGNLRRHHGWVALKGAMAEGLGSAANGSSRGYWRFSIFASGSVRRPRTAVAPLLSNAKVQEGGHAPSLYRAAAC